MTIAIEEYIDRPDSRGDADPEEVAAAFLGRIEHRADLNAVVAVNEDRAARDAARVARARREGRRLPLDGLPVLIKDNIDVADTVCQVGSPLFEGRVAGSDARIVERLSEAGAIVLGKTTLHELVYGGTTDSPFFGRTCNPWDARRTVGGSSGGSGAAAAAGLCAVAIGSDTGGSIRLPAHANGVVGLRPTFGAVSTRGAHPIGPSFDTVGPLARHASDAAMVQSVIAGFDPEDMYSVGRPAVGAGWPVRAMVLGEDTFGAVDPGVAERIDAGLDLLRSLGVQTARCALDGFRQARTDTVAVIRAEAWARYRDDLRLHPEKFSDETAKRLRSGDEISAPDLVGAQWRVLEWRRRIRALLTGEFDLLILPAVPVVAPISGSAEMIETTAELTSLTAPISAAHVPAVSVPCGFSEGMPVGIQIVAGPGRDLELLSLAARMQAAQPTPPWPPARQR